MSIFAEASAVEPTGDGSFAADIHPAWTIAGKPNGGYLLAILGRAAGAVSPHPDVLAASAHYLRSPDPGRVEIEVEVLRTGRSASHVRARMGQAGVGCVEAMFTVGRLEADGQPFWDAGAPAIGTVPWEDCRRLTRPPAPPTAVTSPAPAALTVALLDMVEIRLEPDTAGFTVGRPAGRGELRGWLALPGGEPPDVPALLFAVDSFPPATFDVERTGWVPTLELTAYVRALPAPGPVRILQRAELVHGRRVDESCTVWDASGRLVAQGRQLASIRLG